LGHEKVLTPSGFEPQFSTRTIAIGQPSSFVMCHIVRYIYISCFRHIRSSEDISSGYSSSDPLYTGAKVDPRDPLVRTSSVGGRIRTRASSKTVPVRKSTVTEVCFTLASEEVKRSLHNTTGWNESC
jgi:hypothetical protein